MNFAPFAFENNQPTSQVPRSITFIGNTGFTANASSYSSVVADDPGLLVIGVGWESISFGLTSVTVNGNAATYTSLPQKNGTIGASLYYYDTTSTSNTIAINFNGSVDRSLISCWLLKGLSSTTPTSIDNVTSNTTSLQITATDYVNTGALGVVVQSNASQNSVLTWTNATKDYGLSVEALAYFGGAEFTTPSPNNYIVTTNWTGGDNAIAYLATWY
jgi:hypothetical protein